jgi:predicted HicB family RNase H-like nuclease
MKTQNHDFDRNFTTLKVQIKPETREKAKIYAKSKGYSFGWWVGSLIERELKKSDQEASK